SLAVLLLGVSLVQAGELRTLKGDLVTGDLVAVGNAEVVLAQGMKRLGTPVPEILQVDLNPPKRLTITEQFLDVEPIHGAILHCSNLAIKKKEAELTLYETGQTLTVPLAQISNVLSNAANDKNRRDWTLRLGKKGRRDVVTVLNDGVVSSLEGTIG